VLLASAAFATSSPLARFARPVHPLTVAFGRVAVAGAFLIALDLPGAARAIRGMTWRQRVTVLAAGVLLAAHFALFLWGLDRTSFAAAVSLVSLEPLSVVVCAWALFGLRPSRREQVGLFLATAGALIISSTAGVGDHRLEGDLLVIGAVVLFGLYVGVARALRDALPSRTYAALVYTGAALTLGAALPLTPGALDAALPPPIHAAAAIVALGLIPTVIGHTAVQSAARHLSPSIVALVCPGETLGGIAIGIALLGALPTAAEILGAAVILAGSMIAITGASGAGAADRASGAGAANRAPEQAAADPPKSA
jgi:drug/metabolite transporter (DMT)-like permease